MGKKKTDSNKKKSVIEVNPIECFVIERVSIEKVDPVLRLYVKLIDDLVMIYFRYTHEYIVGLKNDAVGRQMVLTFLEMSQSEFYSDMESIGFNFKAKFHDRWFTESPRYKDAEDWFNNAWLGQTERYFTSLGFPIEKAYENLPKT